jgi:hypothetical protein
MRKASGLKWEARGVLVASLLSVADKTTSSIPERRAAVRTDRRKYSRSGRRGNDPHVNWRRLAWLFAGYALFMSLRSLPSTVKKRLFDRRTRVPS